MKVLVFGDAHLFTRAKEIPKWVIDLIKKEKINTFFCTGDLEDQYVYDFFKNKGDLYCVRGNCDFLDLPRKIVLKIGSYKIGIIHGNQVYPPGNEEELEEVCDNLDCDILINGHTHVQKVYIRNNKLFVNPGSLTGVWSGRGNKEEEAVVVLDINKEVNVYLYKSNKLIKTIIFKK